MNRLPAWLLIGLALPASAAAQTPNAYFGDIATQLRRGERTVVWTVNGDVIRGRLVEATGEGLRLERALDEIVLAASEVQRVERVGDGIWNGAAIGAAVGFASGAIMMATCEPGFFCDNSWQAVLACGGLAGAFGFGVGALGDWFVRPERLVFERGAQPSRVTVAPELSRRGGAVRVRVVF
jgi:hypothetical protein